MAIDLVATTGGRHTYNDPPLLMTPLAIGSNTIRGYEDSAVISLPLPAGPRHAPCQGMAKRAAKTPFGIRGVPGSWHAHYPCSTGLLTARTAQGQRMDFGRCIQQPPFWEAAGAVKTAPTLESGGPGI